MRWIIHTCVIALLTANPILSKKEHTKMLNLTHTNLNNEGVHTKRHQNNANDTPQNKALPSVYVNNATSSKTLKFLRKLDRGQQKAYNALARMGYKNITMIPSTATNSSNLQVNVIHTNASSDMNGTLHNLGYNNITLFPRPISMGNSIESTPTTTTHKLITTLTTPSTNQSLAENTTSQMNVNSSPSTLNSSLTEEPQLLTSELSVPDTSTETESPMNETSVIANYTVPRSYAISETIANSNTSENQTQTLIYTWVIFSHGFTTPVNPYPNDPYKVSHWKNKLNWLTEAGKQQMHNLGNWTRQRYSSFCNRYDSAQITILSEGSDSMLVSAESFVAGLFPPIYSTSQANKSLSWQPIPIHTVPSTVDLLMTTSSSIDECRQYQLEINKEEQMTEWTNIRDTYADALNYTATHAGYQLTSSSIVSDLSQIYECNYDLTAEHTNNLSLPSWTKKVYPEPMNTLALKYLLSLTGTPTLQKLKTGPAIGVIIDSIKNKVAGNLTERLHILSGNTGCLVSIMNSLGMNNSGMPSFASILLIELHKKNDEFVIMISLKNGTQEPHLLAIPNCRAECPFDEFIRLTQWLVPTNWEEECSVISIGNLTWSTPLLVAGLVVIIVLIFLTVLMLIKFCRCFNKRTARINSGR